MIESSTPLDGVYLAATLVQINSQVPVRVAKFTDRMVKLKPGALLGDIIEVIPEDEPPCSTDAHGSICQAAAAPHNLVPEYLQELGSRVGENLDTEQRAAAVKLLAEFQDVFARNDIDLDNFAGVAHHIDTGTAKPVRHPPRWTPLGFQNEEEHLKKTLEAGIIEPSNSQWASPVVLMRKKDGGVRWCADYRALNAVTTKDAYPLPKIKECLDTLAGRNLVQHTGSTE